MSLSTLRIELPDDPGALAGVTRVLADLGLNLVEVSIHETDGATAVDELILSSAAPPDVPTLRSAVDAAGAALLSVAPCTRRVDLVAAAMGWLVETLDDPRRLSTLTAGLQIMTGVAPLRAVTPAEAERTPSGRAAIARGATVVRREETSAEGGEASSSADVAGWVLAAADGTEPTVVVFGYRPHSVRFTATEVRRMDAVLRCRRRVLQALGLV